MNIFKSKFFDNIIKYIEKYYYIFLIVILVVALINLFYNLGKFPINSWDEARHGVSAYEMIKRNNYIVNTYSYTNDYWNLKPPISYWAIAAGYKIAGYNALGLRIFSALAGFITILSIAVFTLHKYGKISSIISTSTITSTMPYILDHCARSGDADSIFVMFFTLSIISISLLNRSIKWLYVSGIAFSLAFLTKSWHAGSIGVIIGLYLILSRKLFKLRIRSICMFFLGCTLPVIIWGIFRYGADKLLFLKNMINYDLLARSSVALEGHVGSTSYYIEVLQSAYFYWMLVLVSTVVAFTVILEPEMLNKDSIEDILPILLWIIVPFLFYTKAKTKIGWYILPIFPAMAVVIGAASGYLLKCRRRNLVFQLLLSILLLFSTYKNEISIMKMIVNPGIDYAQETLKNIGRLSQYRGHNIYTLYKTNSADNPNRWDQSYLLCAELYGDLNAVEGGVNAFLKDKTSNPLLLISKDKILISEIQKNNLKVVTENEFVYILGK